MLRFVLLLALFCALSCSKEPPLTAPAGKSNCALCDILGDGTHQAPEGSGGHTTPDDDDQDTSDDDDQDASDDDDQDTSDDDNQDTSDDDDQGTSDDDDQGTSDDDQGTSDDDEQDTSASLPVSPPDSSSLSDEILIPDTALRTFIEQALEKSPGETITQADMNTLTSLEAKDLGIKDLRGLETAKNLTSVNIDSNRVLDLTPLATLTNLEFLAFSNTQVFNLTPLAALTNLKWLYFFDNQVSDLTPLATLTNLEHLGFSDNRVSDITPLATLTNLEWLYFSVNQVSNLTPLATLTNLKWLYFSDNRVSDITPLKNLSNLRELNFAWNSVSDLSPLVALPHLERLDALSNPLSKVSIDEHIPALQRRDVDVSFAPFHSFTVTETESPFSIEFVFLGGFTEEEQEVWHHAANRWEAAIQTEFPDYTFSSAWSGACGYQSINIPEGERIDDLRIYVSKFREGNPFLRGYGGYGAPIALRSNSLPIIGCIGIATPSTFSLQRLRQAVLHEIGHVLGIGTIWFSKGMIRELNGDTHFPGPKAIAAFDQAGGTDYQGAKVPTQRDGFHWRTSALSGEIMSTVAANPVISAITLQALSDMGYSVDLSATDPYVRPSSTAAKPVADEELEFFCTLEGLPAPVYLDD